MIPLIIVRPQPGCDASVAAARSRGLCASGFPLFEVRSIAWEAPDPATIDAVLIGSANGLAHAGPALASFAGKPAYAVGDKTAEAAAAAGLALAAIGVGGLQAVLDEVPPRHARLLRLAGRDRVALAAPQGVTLVERVVYASEPQPMSAPLAERLSEPAVVMLHSGEAAHHFAAQCEARELDRARLSLVAIGPRVAQTAGLGWATVAVADAPRDSAMLALAEHLCQTAAGSP